MLVIEWLGGKDSGAINASNKESEYVLSQAMKLGKKFQSTGIKVVYTRTSNTYVALQDRTKKANSSGADLFLSMHLNSFSDKNANGFEALYHSTSVIGKQLAQALQTEMSTMFRDRKIKARDNLHVLRASKMPAVLIETGFISNASDLSKIKNKEEEIVDKIFNVICNFYSIKPAPSKPTPVKGNVKIMDKASATIQQMQDWATNKKANPTFIKLAPIFYEVSVRNGVNPVVTYTQSAKETGYMKFGGVLDESFKNPCGLKVSAGGGDKDPNAHKRFKTWEEGIEAQVDHLGLYAGGKGYPKKNTPDPRHFPYLAGKCKTVESLSGNWAPSSDYGTDLVKMMRELEKTPVKKPTEKNTIKVNLFGKIREMNGTIEKGTSYMVIAGNKMPLRQTFEDLGFDVDWDNSKRMVVVK